MTTTLQEALMKAGLISKEKLQKSENEKKQAARAERHGARQKAEYAARPDTRKAQDRRGAGPDKRGSQGYQRQGRVEGEAPSRLVGMEGATRAPIKAKKSLGFIEGKHHHHMRTACEICGKSSPDVEYYDHKDKRIEKNWFCVRCADDKSIPDQTRMTKQSQHAQSGMFRRNYGPTKVFR